MPSRCSLVETVGTIRCSNLFFDFFYPKAEYLHKSFEMRSFCTLKTGVGINIPRTYDSVSLGRYLPT